DGAGRGHPCDPGFDAGPSETIHDGPGDGRLARAVRAHDRVHVRGPGVTRLHCIPAIVRPFPLARSAVRFHGKTSIGIWEVPQNRAGDRLDDWRHVDDTRKRIAGRVGVLLSSEGSARRNVKVIRPGPLFFLPSWTG